MATHKGPKIVVIGGGTGTFSTLLALKYYTHNITAIVSMSDNGASTGILRDELGVLPPGDVRQCLVALSESDQVMRDLFTYRFEEGSLKGHSFGNLFLTALEKITGSFAEAAGAAGEVLKTTGQVLPVSLASSDLVYTTPDGKEVVGEHTIETTDFKGDKKPLMSLKLHTTANPAASSAIAAADVVVLAPGDIYTSLAPALIVDGMGEALRNTKAKVVYVSNLVNKPGQTPGYAVHDYASEIERFIGAPVIKYVIFNNHEPSPELLSKYAAAGEHPVGYDEAVLAKAHYHAIGDDLVSKTVPKLKAVDQLIPRNFIRHDSDKLARVIMRIFF